MNEIIVGLDDSPLGAFALDWAIREAHRAGAGLRVVHTVPPWVMDDEPHPKVAEIRQWLLGSAREVVDRGLDHARALAPDTPVTGAVVAGPPARGLLEASGDAAMTVVGTHGANALSGLLLGSVAWQVAAHAPCPVIVVRGDDRTAYGEVLVGVDGSPGGEAALEFAFGEASRNDARLHAVLAWHIPVPMASRGVPPVIEDFKTFEKEEASILEKALKGPRERHPDVVVVSETVCGSADRVLIGASARADLVVVGSRGRGGFTGLLLGSVGHALLHRSHCPVAVVRPHSG